MSGTLTLHNYGGLALGAVRNPLYTVEWRINTVTQLRFTLSTRDAACREDWLRPGNLVLLDPGNGLPIWGGVIDLPREWGRGTVNVTAYSAEQLLSWRRPAQMGQLVRGTPGSIYRQMVKMATGAGYMPVETGDIYEGGKAREETLEDDLLAECQRIAERAGHEFELTPVVRNGRLVFLANWYERMGETTDLILQEPVDLRASERPLVEQGTIVNDLLGYGDGATWQSRPKVTRRDAASAGLYGLRQDALAFDGNTMIGTLEENTQQELAKRARPRRTLDVLVTNTAAYGRIRKGNVARVVLASAGFSGSGFGADERKRIAGFGYDCNAVRLIGEDE